MNKTTPLPLSHQTFLALYCDAAKALPLLEGENNFAHCSGPAWMRELAAERFELVASFLLSSIYEYAERPDILQRVQDVVLETLADGENEDEEWQEEHSPPPPPQDFSQKKVKPKSKKKPYARPIKYRRRLCVQAQDHRLVASIKSLTKDDGTRYVTVLEPTGYVHCSCPSGIYRPGTLCRHGRRLLGAAKRRQIL